MYTAIIQAPFGKIKLEANDTFLAYVGWAGANAKLSHSSHPIIMDAMQQLGAYFRNPNYQFNLPLQLNGTEHQIKVWRALQKIKSGSTLTYSDLAAKLDSGARAVGNACRNNPISIVVPCHRIVAKSGLGGFSGKTAGLTLDIKKWLLGHEGNQAAN